MMRRVSLVLLTFALAAGNSAQTKPEKPDVQTRKETPAKPAAEGKTPAANRARATPAAGVPDRALMQRIWDAWSTLDPAKAAPFYAKDAELVFYDIAPTKYTGWNDYAAGAAKLLAGFQSLKATVNDDAQIYSRNGGALGTATWHGDVVNKDGSKSTLDGRWTVLWERRGTQWLIVHEHVSVPMK